MMYDVDQLILMGGNDIIVPNYAVKIHQPTINEIALIGEEQFFSTLNIFMINSKNFKSTLLESIPSELIDEIESIQNLNELEVLLFLISSEDSVKNSFNILFKLLLPDFEFEFSDIEFRVLLKSENVIIELDEELFLIIKDIVFKIFIFDKLFDGLKYKPIDERAQEIADKLQKAKNKMNKNESKEYQSLLANIISILGVTGQSIIELNNFTIYQLYNQFERFALYMQYDQSIKAALAGAKVDIIDWFKQL